MGIRAQSTGNGPSKPFSQRSMQIGPRPNGPSASNGPNGPNSPKSPKSIAQISAAVQPRNNSRVAPPVLIGPPPYTPGKTAPGIQRQITSTVKPPALIGPPPYTPWKTNSNVQPSISRIHTKPTLSDRVMANPSRLDAISQSRYDRANQHRVQERPAAARTPIAANFGPPAGPKAPVPYRPANDPATSVQRYKVLPPGKIYQNAPAKRPWFGYPYVIVRNAPFNAQAQAHGVGGNDQFLTAPGGNNANIVNHPGGLSLRVSNNNDMAIENSDLVQRQPKAFYATQGIVNDANQRLQTAGSRIRLQANHGQSITIWTGWWWGDKVLYEVTPQFNNGNPDALPQNCNAVAAQVIGSNADWVTSKGAKAAEIAARLAPTARAAYREAYNAPDEFDENRHSDAIAEEYVTSATERSVKAYGANQFARPNVGETYMIATVGGGQRLPSGLSRVRDYRSGQDRDLGWSFHFAGVVAISGSDRVTLENYARGDNRQDNADPRWYFQMYGETRGQSFHEFHEARRDYSNPLTLAVNPNTQATAIHRI
jgi:hypothetical protein